MGIMKTVRIVTVMEANSVSGPAKNLLRFCRLIKDRPGQAFEISIATFIRVGHASQPATNEFTDAIRAADVSVDVIRERRRFDIGVLPQLRTVFRNRAPDIIQTHGVKAHFLTRLTKPQDTRWLAYHHGYTAEDLRMRLYNRLDRWSLPASDFVVTVCNRFSDRLVSTGVVRDRIRVLPNSIEPITPVPSESVSVLRGRWKIPTACPIVLSVGRLSREKGHRDLIEAAWILRNRRPDLPFHVLIIGDGPERERLHCQIAKRGLGEHVRLAGRQRDPSPCYAIADVFVLPSYSEGSPNVVLEAMAAGVPIVACAVGGVPEMVDHERTALLVKSGQPIAIADAIEKLLINSSLRLKLHENALHDVRSWYSPKSYCDALVAIYSYLLNSTSGGA